MCVQMPDKAVQMPDRADNTEQFVTLSPCDGNDNQLASYASNTGKIKMGSKCLALEKTCPASLGYFVCVSSIDCDSTKIVQWNITDVKEGGETISNLGYCINPVALRPSGFGQTTGGEESGDEENHTWRDGGTSDPLPPILLVWMWHSKCRPDEGPEEVFFIEDPPKPK